MTDITDCLSYIQKVRRMRPLVNCITNTVTIWDCANILLAAGASPTMAHHPQEMAEIAAGCQALVCNLGATESFDAMLTAAQAASALGHPIVVDPVGCGGSSFRRAFFRQLTEKAQISCVRGNAAEITALADDMATVTGVDAPELSADQQESLLGKAMQLAKRLGCIVIASGPVDLVTDGCETIEVHAGDAMMSRITGTGCMSSALLGAFLAADRNLECAAACCSLMGHCGEVAALQTKTAGRGTMTFHMHLIDEMSRIGYPE